MKIKKGFVSNSSSTSFYIFNKTHQPLPLIEMVKEAAFVLDEFNKEYGFFYTLEELEKAAQERGIILQPGENVVVFGDEQGDAIGNVYDYALRPSGKTKRFGWSVKEFLR